MGSDEMSDGNPWELALGRQPGPEVPIPDADIGVEDLHLSQLERAVHMAANERIWEEALQGVLPIPPVRIAGEDITVLEVNDGQFVLWFNRVFERAAQLLQSGRTELEIYIPPLTSRLIGNMLHDGFYFIDVFYQKAFQGEFTQLMLQRHSLPVRCETCLVEEPNDELGVRVRVHIRPATVIEIPLADAAATPLAEETEPLPSEASESERRFLNNFLTWCDELSAGNTENMHHALCVLKYGGDNLMRIFKKAVAVHLRAKMHYSSLNINEYLEVNRFIAALISISKTYEDRKSTDALEDLSLLEVLSADIVSSIAPLLELDVSPKRFERLKAFHSEAAAVKEEALQGIAAETQEIVWAYTARQLKTAISEIYPDQLALLKKVIAD